MPPQRKMMRRQSAVPGSQGQASSDEPPPEEVMDPIPEPQSWIAYSLPMDPIPQPQSRSSPDQLRSRVQNGEQRSPESAWLRSERNSPEKCTTPMFEPWWTEEEAPVEMPEPEPETTSVPPNEVKFSPDLYSGFEQPSREYKRPPPKALKEKKEEDKDPRKLMKGHCSEHMMEWHDAWVHAVECGELDIYTCLGLSNAASFGPDTRRVIAKVIGVGVLQVVVPCILLYVELEAGFSYNPRMPGYGFRTMGVCLYLYSLYSMYNNALDECRSRLLQWAIDQDIPLSYWVPMAAGEVTNVFVSLILVVSLFVIFVETEHPADLILNAVAVNFLGAVDGEFVNDAMTQDALVNFEHLFFEFGDDEDASGQEMKHEHRMLNVALNLMLFIIVASGFCLSAVFFFAATKIKSEPLTSILNATNFINATRVARGGYPRLV